MNSTARDGMEPHGTHAVRNDNMRALATHRLNISRARKIGMFTERMEIAPEFAAMILEQFAPEGTNRTLRRNHVASLAAQMADGKWNPNTHQGIAFRTDGVLADGQHRLAASVQAGVSFTVPVTYGQPEDVFFVLDDGARRSPADILQIGGATIVDKALVASVARQLLGLGRGSDDKRLTLEFVQRNTELLSVATRYARSVTNQIRKRVTPTPLATAIFLISRVADSNDVKRFVDCLASGADLSGGNPILTLRNALINKTIAHSYRHYDDANHVVAAAVVLAWNLWRSGRKCASVRPLVIGKDDAFPAVRA